MGKSKREKTKGTPATAVPGAAQAVQSVVEMLCGALLAAVESTSIRTKAKLAGEGVAGAVLTVAKQVGTLAGFEAAIKHFNNWLLTQEGVSWQKAHGLTLGITKDGKSVKLPGSFKNYTTACRQYLSAQSVPDSGLPAITTYASMSKVRAAVESEPVQRALDRVRAGVRKVTEAERNAILALSEMRRHAQNEHRLLGEELSALNADRLAEAVKALHTCRDVTRALAEAQAAEETAAKAAKEAAKIVKAKLPEAAEPPAQADAA